MIFYDNLNRKLVSKYILDGGTINVYTINVYDIETDEILGELNLTTLASGLQLLADCKDKNGKEIPDRHWNNLINYDFDYETVDVIIQLAVMGEIVYG